MTKITKKRKEVLSFASNKKWINLESLLCHSIHQSLHGMKEKRNRITNIDLKYINYKNGRIYEFHIFGLYKIIHVHQTKPDY